MADSLSPSNNSHTPSAKTGRKSHSSTQQLEVNHEERALLWLYFMGSSDFNMESGLFIGIKKPLNPNFILDLLAERSGVRQ